MKMQLPDMVTIKQRFEGEFIVDVESEALEVVNRSGVLSAIGIGSRVAVGVGSRGIVNYADVVRGVCRAIKEAGAIPFIFPAMGSHGGGTSQDERNVLQARGIDENTVNAEILCDATGVRIGETEEGIPLHIDRNALKADHIVLVNRVKPHTKFTGPVESGISKMMAVGMGKVTGAAHIHRNYAKFGFAHVIPKVVQTVMRKVPFSFGVAIIETAFKKIHSLSVLTPETMKNEEVLLKESASLMAKIPFDQIDVLIVDRMGKEISGVGMDTNVIGRKEDLEGRIPGRPRVHRIFVRDLTEKTQGNAHGMGLADFTTRRMVEKIDLKKTLANAVTAMNPQEATTPLALPCDREGIEASLQSLGLTGGRDARVVRIKNTSQLDQMQVSQSLAEYLREARPPHLEITGTPGPMIFDGNGNLGESY
ncbi:MAG: DUF362 domain-containing protein [bacterium]|nr:DUF362 domain-containing protein [bacterium]